MIYRKIIKLFWIILLVLFTTTRLEATHNRAGEITIRQINDLTIEITITTFTYTLSPADRSQLDVSWGDNTSSVAGRVSAIDLPGFYRKNTYIAQHTYPGPGTYQIVVQDPNRNLNVLNIPNSVNVVFSVKTIFSLDPSLGTNSSPVLLNFPIDRAGLNRIFIHNPAAFDPDGDSLSYSLAVCTRENGIPIENYSIPPASDSLYVDPVTGDLVWNAPVDTGIFNIAMNITEWRNGVKIGNIARDMQVEVYRTNNHPPVNDSMRNLCVMAGDTVRYRLVSTDPDGDAMTRLVTGGPFALDDGSISYSTETSSPGFLSGILVWNTSCNHPRQQPYSIVVKTTDINPELDLVDIDNLFIKVLAPPPENPELIPSSNTVNVFWDPHPCSNIKAYNIYRKEGSSAYVYDSCTPGLPSNIGFELVGFTTGRNSTSFQDDNQGDLLLQGVEYCYRITAILPDGSESFPSGEVCTTLVPGSPSLLSASVTSRAETGSVFVSWARPTDLDTIPANGPYEYRIYRAQNLWGTGKQLIHSFKTSNLDDTTYIDSPLNTLVFPYAYTVELYNDAPGNTFLIGKAETASTTYLQVSNGDNAIKLDFIRNVPWINQQYTIYRYNSQSGLFDSIAITTEDSFTDTGLKNEETYCYYVKSVGTRTINGSLYEAINLSHQACGTPGDTIPPCPPDISLSSNCQQFYNQLDWSYQPGSTSCSEDVTGYKLYYSPSLNTPPQLLVSIDGKEQNTYRHYPAVALPGCYYITAIDSFSNESLPSATSCIDSCSNYGIPNVFTPDNDKENDILKPYKNQDVERIDMKIYNRWGQVVFETTDPEINWDGKLRNTNELVSPGVYYYVCDVYEYRITGIEVRNLVGFIHVFHSKGATNTLPDEKRR